MKKWLTLVFLFSIMLSYGQDNIIGVVAEKLDNGKEGPLPGANVYWLGTTSGVTTKLNGVFVIPRHSTTDRLVISFVGFKSDTLIVADNNNVKVILESDVLDEVVVEAWKPTSGLSYLQGINTVEMDEEELFKAACCNLSESFETNPSVDVSFTDALTGTRQIQMLGLSGSNTMISVENMPGLRGIASNYGLSYIPGTWINSIQVTKGVGSVVNGHESIAGQINVELKKPEESEKLFLNGYINGSGRTELNLNVTQRVGKKWSTTTLLHGDIRPIEHDRNDDSFLDLPVANQYNFINRWVYKGNKGWLGQFGVKVLGDQKRGGELDFVESRDRNTMNSYGLEINAKRYEAWGKLGYVFSGKPYKSFGFQVSGVRHEHDSYFGLNDYDADQNTFYGNFIYQSVLSNTAHKFKTGLSIIHDEYDEQLNDLKFDRKETVPGAFFEYTYDNSDNLTIIAGIRADYNSLFDDIFLTPRLHLRYNATPTTVVRASIGEGRRTANIIAENTGVLASSREIRFSNLTSNKAYGFRQDKALNLGLNIAQEFIFDYRNGIINVDFYHTRFSDQVVLDLDQSPQQAIFLGLNGTSYSNSLQAQIDYQLAKRLDLRMAYRWLDVQVDYTESQLQKPLVARNRAFVNLAYETKSNWSFDYTLQWTGEQRVPNTSTNPESFQRSVNSVDFIMMNAQVTKSFKKGLAIYLGIENINNFTQDDPIISSADPFSPYFDSSLVWAPIFGRMVYAGFRFRVE